MKKLVVATNNLNKLYEYRSLLKNSDFEAVSLKDIGYQGDIEETGTTFSENAVQKAFSGEAIQLDDYTKLMVKLPQRANVKIIYEGQLVWQVETDNLEFDKLDHGKYRMEAYFQGKPWVFSNPIALL